MSINTLIIIVCIVIHLTLWVYTIIKKIDIDFLFANVVLLGILLNIMAVIFIFGLWESITKPIIKYNNEKINIIAQDKAGLITLHKEDKKLYYYVYSEEEKGTYKLLKLPCDKYIIKETNQQTAYIEKGTEIRRIWFLYSKSEWVGSIIYVPKGTIIKEFKNGK